MDTLAETMRPITLHDLNLVVTAQSVAPDDDNTPARAPVCPACQGMGWYKEAVPFGHPHFGRLFPCACKRLAQAQAAIDAHWRGSNLDAVSDLRFETFKRYCPSVEHAYDQARAYAASLDGWLLLFGPYGVGKTHLAAAIALSVFECQIPVIFSVVPDLLDHLRATYGPKSEVSYDARFDAIREVSLLVLDDWGTESDSPWAKEKLYQLMNHRYQRKLPTVVTSNCALERIDPRIRSRMSDRRLCQMALVDAPDYRLR